MGALGALLVASLFLAWYGGPRAAASAWEAYTLTDVVLLVAGLVGVTALVLTLAQRTPAVPLALTTIGVFVALIGALLAVVGLVAAPEPAGAGGEAERLSGAWIGTALAIGLLAAMLASIRDERTSAPEWSREEQAAAVRTLTLSSSGGGGSERPRPAQPGGTP